MEGGGSVSFEILPGSISGAPPEYELGFRVIWKGQARPFLRVFFSGELMCDMGWTDTTRICLLFDLEARLGRLAVAKNGRKISHTAQDGRGEVLVIYTDAEAAIFPQYSTLCELIVTEKSLENGYVTFELPEEES